MDLDAAALAHGFEPNNEPRVFYNDRKEHKQVKIPFANLHHLIGPDFQPFLQGSTLPFRCTLSFLLMAARVADFHFCLQATGARKSSTCVTSSSQSCFFGWEAAPTIS